MLENNLVKVGMLDAITYLNRTPIFESYVICCGSKNKHSKDMLFKEIRLHARIMTTILSSVVDIIGRDLYDQLMSTRIFALKMIKIYTYEL